MYKNCRYGIVVFYKQHYVPDALYEILSTINFDVYVILWMKTNSSKTLLLV